jgi:hypothetical protein
MDILQEKAAPAVHEYGERQLPGYGGGLFNSIVRSGTEMAPGLGDVLAAEDLQTAAQNNDWGGIGLGILGAIPGIPAIGRTARGGRRARADSPLARMGELMADSAPAPSRTSVGQTEAESALARYQAANPNDTGARVLSPGDEGYPTNAQWDEASQAYVAQHRRLPQSEALVTYDPPSVEQMQRFGRVERVPLSAARGSQNWMDWDRVNSGVRPGDMVPGYGDKPLAIRREDGEYVLMDGHHRTVRAIEAGDVDADMYVIDAKDFAPDIAGRAPKPVKYDRQEIDDLLAELTAPVEPDYPIRAYHGSPHSFDQFSLDKIGTGEGAQAYGHGLYFAESEDVARGYRDQLSHQGPMIGGAPIQSGHLSGAAARFRTVDDYIAAMEPRLEEARQAVIDGDDLEALLSQARPQTIQKQIDEARQYAGQEFGHGYHGSMYEVGINAHPDTFLDWDAPLSRQPSQIDAAFAEMGTNRQELAEILFDNGTIDEPRLTGERIYEKLADFTSGPDAVSDVMARNGINGIRYLDGNSRGVGEGSSNYVVFNDELVKILRKYGISGLGIGTGSAALLGSELERRGQAQEF